MVGFQNLQVLKAQWVKDPRAEIFEMDRERTEKFKSLIAKYPKSEPALLTELSQVAKSDFTYIGNSLPIREWDFAQSLHPQNCRQAGNRGANGIDGQISSFLGGSKDGGENWALLGDLTALYDLSALWATRQLEDKKLRLVVINNQGGQIFKNIFGKDIFLNRHEIEFSAWARMWNWDYAKWSEIPAKIDLSQFVVIELTPDSEQSHLFWEEYKSL